MAGARALVPGAGRVRRSHGCIAELARRRRAARLRPVDPAGAPRDVGRRRARVGRARRPGRVCGHPRRGVPRRRGDRRGVRRRRRQRTIPAAGGRRRTKRRGRRGPAAPAAVTPLAAAHPRAHRPARDPVHPPAERGHDLERHLPQGRPRRARGRGGRGVRWLHGRDGRRPVHQRPLDRPLGPDVGRPGRRR